MAGKQPKFGVMDMVNVPFVAPNPGERPVDRFFRFGDFGMVFGEPDNNMFGKPVFIEPVPEGFPEAFGGDSADDDNDIFDKVKAHRKDK